MLCLAHTANTVTAGDRVLKRENHAALLQAQDLISLAQQEAALIRQQAEEHFQRRSEEGYQQGLAEGKAAIAEHIVQCMSQSAAYFSKVEDVMVDVVMRATRRVLGSFEQHEVIEQVVRRALETTRNEGHITVRVAPAHAEWLKGRVDGILGEFPKVQFLEVVPDDRLPADGCVLETEIGVVDATLETQFKAIEKALIRAMK